MDPMTTYIATTDDVQRAWHLIDAEGLVLGRVCTEIATILRGKHKPTYTPSRDTGDHVVVINAQKILRTSDKANTEMLYDYSGYPGGLKAESFAHLLARKPDEAIRRTVRGMLPKGRLGRQMIKKLAVYGGAEHPHAAQSPKLLDLPKAKARSAAAR
jgi:large subunit ribosomal protein L13